MDFELEVDDMAEVDRLHESGELKDYLAARRETPKDRYRVEGLKRGLAAERDLLGWQARRKFDACTAERLAGILADIEGTDGLARGDELIIDCASGEELVATLANSQQHSSWTCRAGGADRGRARVRGLATTRLERV